MGRAYTWEMIRGSGGGGVVVKTDTPSGRRYLARKLRDQLKAEGGTIADYVEDPWFPGNT